MSIAVGRYDSERTHCDLLLVMFPAADQMRGLGGDFECKGTAVGFYPLFNLVVRAGLAKVSGDCDCKWLKWLFHVDGYSVK